MIQQWLWNYHVKCLACGFWFENNKNNNKNKINSNIKQALLTTSLHTSYLNELIQIKIFNMVFMVKKMPLKIKVGGQLFSLIKLLTYDSALW